MNYGEMITYADSMISNLVEQGYKLKWLNEVDKYIFNNVCTEFRIDNISLISGQLNYTLSPYLFEDIKKVTVNSTEYTKMSILDNFENSYYKYNKDIAFNPVPSTNGQTAEIIYLYKPLEKLEANLDDELEISALFGEEYECIYEYWLRYKILFAQREFEESNQMAMMYNEALADFAKWYYNGTSNSVAEIRKAKWVVT